MQLLQSAGLILLGLIAGSGLTYGFRGWIQREKNKLEGAVRTDVGAVHNLLSAAVLKADSEVKAEVQKALAALSKWMPIKL